LVFSYHKILSKSKTKLEKNHDLDVLRTSLKWAFFSSLPCPNLRTRKFIQFAFYEEKEIRIEKHDKEI